MHSISHRNILEGDARIVHILSLLSLEHGLFWHMGLFSYSRDNERRVPITKGRGPKHTGSKWLGVCDSVSSIPLNP